MNPMDVSIDCRLTDSELSAVPSEFVLYGGTALALHLGHRDSVDYGHEL